MNPAAMVAEMADLVSAELTKRDAALRSEIAELRTALEVVKAAPVVTLESVAEPVVVKGEKGEPGESVAGPPGPAGPQGDPGAKGDPGDAVAGPPGEKGEPGARGADGVGIKGDPGTNARDGRDGKDGIASLDEIKAIATKAVDDRIEAEVQKRVAEAIAAMPVVLYKGVFREGEEYAPGSVVTWAGSAWHAEEVTKEKPGDGKTAWVLMVKKGRDAK